MAQDSETLRITAISDVIKTEEKFSSYLALC